MAKCGKVDYSKSMIYKLCCKDVNIKEIYVGSTTNLIKRKYLHKSNCYNKNIKNYNCYVYKFIRDNGGFKNWSMIMIENYSCEKKRELEKRERYFMELLNATLNTYKPFTTEEEKKEQLIECNKEWQEKNKKKILEKQKQYQDKNKDKIKEKKKEYYQNNKNELNEKKNQKFNCECGGKYTLSNRLVHLKTTKHLNYIRLYFNILRQNKTIIK